MEDHEKKLQEQCDKDNAEKDNSGRRQSHWEVIGGQRVLVED